MAQFEAPSGVRITRGPQERYDEILNNSSLSLLADLERRFRGRRRDLMQARAERQANFDGGQLPDFLPETAEVRQASWQVPPPAPGLVDRRVEITGPTDRKMTINALNSGAKVWLADFEDANTPSWENMVEGQINLRDAIDRKISFTSPEGKLYEIAHSATTMVVRPRGWHLVEKHVLVDGEPVAAGLFDFAMHMAHSAARLVELGLGPYYYLPKLEGHLEARLWNEVFEHAEESLGMPVGTIRATVLIETLPAAFEMDEILFELREHSAGLNAGRWDYLFSTIKKLRNLGSRFVLPDRNSVTMGAPFMSAYANLLVQTAHTRGAHAIGGMAAFIPSRHDPDVNRLALSRVREDKEREAKAGFDGSWVAHPDLVSLCSEVFDSVLGHQENQISSKRPKVEASQSDLLDVTSAGSDCTEAGLRNNVSVALQYLASWLDGSGAVAIFNLMEDAATTEIARSQIWQWLRAGVVLTSGEKMTKPLVERVIAEETDKLRDNLGADFRNDLYEEARALLHKVALDDDFAEFFTVLAYESMP